LLLFAIQFLYLLFITLPFDINDIERDTLNQTQTIPAVFGIRNSRLLCVGWCIADIVLLCFFQMPNTAFLFIAVLQLILAYITLFHAHQISKTRIMLFYDGSMIAYFIGVLAGWSV
jgi:4-hydroxybenzoate polyprenyltransferase